MSEKLKFTYSSTLSESVACHNGYRIRAAHDETPENPFEDNDCEWPVLVQMSGRGGRHDVTRYEKNSDFELEDVFKRFNDHQLVHDQITIARILGISIRELLLDYSEAAADYCYDADVLRDGFSRELADIGESVIFEKCVELYEILGIPALCNEVHGHCQGDWARVLVVATPEACAKLMGETYFAELRDPEHIEGEGQFRVGCKEYVSDWHPTIAAARAEYDKLVADGWEKQLQSTIDLYEAWAWGDVYGYIVEKPIEWDEDGDVTEWEEVPDGSCWGFYGSDFDESGLAEQALDSVPEEPAPVYVPEQENA